MIFYYFENFDQFLNTLFMSYSNLYPYHIFRKRQSQENNNKDMKSYDVFISYAQIDQEWVVDTLVAGIEERGYIVCLDKRDYDTKIPKNVNLELSLHNSLTIIIVLSPEYLDSDSEWLPLLAFIAEGKEGGQLKTLLESKCFVSIIYRECPVPEAFKNHVILNWMDSSGQKYVWKKLFKYLGMMKRRSGMSIKIVIYYLYTCN